MLFRQLIHDDLGCASYLIGDPDASVAAVVDPRFDIDGYLELARYCGVRIEHVLETHTHADHVSGHGRLAAATGASIHVFRGAAPEYAHEPFDDGWELELGNLLVRAMHTPGHRPEHCAFALVDRRRGDEPWALLTGDSVFVGDVARPDLAVDPEEGAREIFRSLHERLLRLPPETEVWPGHLGGSLCGGAGMDLKVSSTIGYEKRHSPLLDEADEERFVRRTTAGLGPQPPNFHRIVELNHGPLVTRGSELMPLASRQVEAKREQGALLIDVRTSEQFDDAHIAGAVAVSTLSAGFGTKLAWIAGPEDELVFVGRDDADARAAARLAMAVGLHDFGGFLVGGMTSWRAEHRPVARTERLPAEQLPERLEADPALQVLDVREESEWRAGHIPGSLFTPYHDLRELPDGLDPGRPVAAICASGQRSALAASLLERLGAREVIHVVDGGVGTWERLGRPVERAEEESGTS